MTSLKQAVFESDLFDYVGLHNRITFHVTSDTRPSHFSACNIEKLGLVHKANN